MGCGPGDAHPGHSESVPSCFYQHFPNQRFQTEQKPRGALNLSNSARGLLRVCHLGRTNLFLTNGQRGMWRKQQLCEGKTPGDITPIITGGVVPQLTCLWVIVAGHLGLFDD